MGINDAQFPTAPWDGISPVRTSRQTDSEPNHEDWDQMVSEVIATQVLLTTVDGNLGQTAIVSLTDSSGGTANDTIEVCPSDTLGNLAAAANNNFADLAAKVEEIIVDLRAAKVILT